MFGPLEQRPRPEIVVVNSGGGGATETLRRAGMDVPVVECPEPLYAGAVCNRGLAATSARFVSFLAADCIARPGWIATRLEAHRAGARAVSGALDNVFPENACATAAYVLLASRRMPHCRADHRNLYGLSYDRALFDRYGRFREDLRDGEDTEFKLRLGAEVDIVWAPGVRSAHRYPTRLLELVGDHHDRGRRVRLYDRQRLGRVLGQAVVTWPLSSVRETMRPGVRSAAGASPSAAPDRGGRYRASVWAAAVSDRRSPLRGSRRRPVARHPRRGPEDPLDEPHPPEWLTGEASHGDGSARGDHGRGRSGRT